MFLIVIRDQKKEPILLQVNAAWHAALRSCQEVSRTPLWPNIQMEETLQSQSLLALNVLQYDYFFRTVI